MHNIYIYIECLCCNKNVKLYMLRQVTCIIINIYIIININIYKAFVIPHLDYGDII